MFCCYPHRSPCFGFFSFFFFSSFFMLGNFYWFIFNLTYLLCRFLVSLSSEIFSLDILLYGFGMSMFLLCSFPFCAKISCLFIHLKYVFLYLTKHSYLCFWVVLHLRISICRSLGLTPLIAFSLENHIFLVLSVLNNLEMYSMHSECFAVETGLCCIPPKNVGGFLLAGNKLGESCTAGSPSLTCGFIPMALSVGCSESAHPHSVRVSLRCGQSLSWKLGLPSSACPFQIPQPFLMAVVVLGLPLQNFSPQRQWIFYWSHSLPVAVKTENSTSYCFVLFCQVSVLFQSLSALVRLLGLQVIVLFGLVWSKVFIAVICRRGWSAGIWLCLDLV